MALIAHICMYQLNQGWNSISTILFIHLSIYLSNYIYLCIHLSIENLSFNSYIYLSVRPNIYHLPIYLSACLSIYISIFLLSLHLSINISIYLYIYLSIPWLAVTALKWTALAFILRDTGLKISVSLSLSDTQTIIKFIQIIICK